MQTFCASCVPVTSGCKPEKDSFAAAAGFKLPAQEPTVLSEFPDTNCHIDGSLSSSIRVVAISSTEAGIGKNALHALATKASKGITQAHIDEAVSALSPEEDSATLVCAVQGTNLVAGQGTASSSIIRCSAGGHILRGITAVPQAEAGNASSTTFEIHSSDDFLILGSTHLLESLSQAQLTRIFAENSENGTSALARSLLNLAHGIEVTEIVKLIVLDLRGWAAHVASSAPVDTQAASPDANSVGKGLSAAAGGVAGGTDAQSATPATNDVAAGVAAAAEGVKVSVLKSVVGTGEAGASTKEGPKPEAEMDPNAPWHQKIVGTAKKHWSTHKSSIMKFAKSRQKTASKDAKKLHGFLGKCGGTGKGDVLHEDDDEIASPQIPVADDVLVSVPQVPAAEQATE